MSYSPHCREREKKILDDCFGRERERGRKLWMIVITSTNWKLIREPLGTSALKEGAHVTVLRIVAAR
jgi:hypothetical protein